MALSEIPAARQNFATETHSAQEDLIHCISPAA